jgi:hypothetical protein
MAKIQSESLPTFRGGPNIALKLPPSVFDATLAFYRDVLRLPLLEQHSPHYAFQFGANCLWLDRAESLSQAEVWLQVIATDTAAAEKHLAAHAVVRCDAIESLPEDFDGFWVLSPSSIVHLICSPNEIRTNAA